MTDVQEWNSPQGRRAIVKIGTGPRGNAVAFVRTGESPLLHMIALEEIASEVRRDELNFAKRSESLEHDTQSAKAEKSRAEWRGFTVHMTAMQSAKADAALKKNMLRHGRPMSRGLIAEELVRAGWHTRQHPSKGRVAEGPDGSYMTQADLTKTTLDYMDFLNQKERQS